jgi:hypothetical protein
MRALRWLLRLSVVVLSKTVLAKQLACDNNIPKPTYFGTEVTSLIAQEVNDYNSWSPFAVTLGIAFDKKPISFCNVTITYTHPGLHDNVHVYVYLPLEGWNGNFLGQGGGGFSAGNPGRQTVHSMERSAEVLQTTWLQALREGMRSPAQMQVILFWAIR